ncbi:MAG: peptidase C40, partial [Mycobacterium sp.]
MRHKRFRFSLVWVTALVAGLLIAVAAPAPASAEPGEWDPTLPAA